MDVTFDPPLPAKYKENFTTGRMALIDDQGYKYSDPKNRKNGLKDWRCSSRNKKCKALIYTKDDWITRKKNHHNHDPPSVVPAMIIM